MTNRVRRALLILLLACISTPAAPRGAAQQLHWQRVAPADGLADSYRIEQGSSTLQVDFAPGTLDLGDDAILHHIQTAVAAVIAYYGRFPVSRARVLVAPIAGRGGAPQGTTWGDMGGFQGFTRLRIGEHATQADLDDDWVTTHELVHMTFPSQEREHHWIEEGLATYIEPLARVKTGELTARKVWGDMVDGMPQGEPAPGDQGLDRTHTWGRTYWGGAQFCLLADVTIREQTHNRKGLQDALRAIVAAGGTIDQNWPITKAFAAGDAGTGTHVLEQQYDRMANAPVTVDLDGLWKKLGIVRTATGIRFDDTAPEAAIRIAITKTPATGRIAPQP